MNYDKNKTTWNSDLFSENQDESYSEKENFQVKQMIQKIKRVKKSRKPIENLQNIELFDTLSNTAGKERFIETLDNLSDKQDTNNSMTIDDDTTCADSRYEGCDNGDKTANADDPRERLIRFINRMYEFFEAWFLFIAFVICIAVGVTSKTTKDGLNSLKRKSKQNQDKELPKGKDELKTVDYYKKKFGTDVSKYNFLPTINDVNIVKKYVAWTFSILISCYVVFHLFFLMFYKNEIYAKEGVKIKDLSIDTLDPFIKPIVNYFLQYAWFFTDKFDKYAIVALPSITSLYLNSSLSFIFLFIFLIMFFYYYPFFLKQLFIDFIRFNTKNSAVLLTFLFVFMLFLVDMFYSVPNRITAPEPIWYIALTVILRLIIINFITIPLAGLFLTGYILLYGLFGIYIYNTSNDNFKIFKDISKFAEDTKHNIRIGTDCSPNSFFEKIMITINLGMDFIYTYIFYLAFIVVLFVSLIDYSINISSTPLKNGLLLVTSSLILMFSCLCINSFRLKSSAKLAEASKI